MWESRNLTVSPSEGSVERCAGLGAASFLSDLYPSTTEIIIWVPDIASFFSWYIRDFGLLQLRELILIEHNWFPVVGAKTI